MERSHGREFQAVSSAPIKKLPASPRISQPGIPVTDGRGEEVNVCFGDFGAGSSDKLRDPRARRSAGHDRKFSLGMSLCELFGVELCALFGTADPRSREQPR
jgi:hypothetical protein